LPFWQLRCFFIAHYKTISFKIIYKYTLKDDA